MNTPTIDLSHRGVPQNDWTTVVHGLPEFDATLHQRLVVVAPHPDDETLGVGGLIAETSRRRVPVMIVSVSDGEAAPVPGSTPIELAIRRRDELRLASAHLCIAGAVDVQRWALPDGRLTEVEREITTRLRRLVQPGDLVVGTLPGDGHPDHEAVGRAVHAMVATPGVSVAFYPVWSWHWHDPARSSVAANGRVVQLSAAALRAKLDALQAYASQTTGDVPVLPAHFVQRFDRPYEVLVPAEIAIAA